MEPCRCAQHASPPARPCVWLQTDTLPGTGLAAANSSEHLSTCGSQHLHNWTPGYHASSILGSSRTRRARPPTGSKARSRPARPPPPHLGLGCSPRGFSCRHVFKRGRTLPLQQGQLLATTEACPSLKPSSRQSPYFPGPSPGGVAAHPQPEAGLDRALR